MGRPVTMRSIPQALDDLERATTVLGTKRVNIVDDTFTVSKRRVMELCRELSLRRTGISFEIFSCTDTLDQETMEALAEAVCVRIFFGVDGGDNEILRTIRKGFRIEDAERIISQAAGFFDVTAFFIWATPSSR
jgi:radical SAM superfamily enzyme YgiQ (UPF0313 family)